MLHFQSILLPFQMGGQFSYDKWKAYQLLLCPTNLRVTNILHSRPISPPSQFFSLLLFCSFAPGHIVTTTTARKNRKFYILIDGFPHPHPRKKQAAIHWKLLLNCWVIGGSVFQHLRLVSFLVLQPFLLVNLHHSKSELVRGDPIYKIKSSIVKVGRTNLNGFIYVPTLKPVLYSFHMPQIWIQRQWRRAITARLIKCK